MARWDPRNAAEVFLYTKIIPQPGEKVPLLHLHALVTKKTLVRAIPLLPDGSSPRASPGILALGIPVVCGRHRGTTQTPVDTRRVGEITLEDGVCIGEEEAVQAQVPSPGSIDLEKPTAGHEVKSACRGQSGGSGEPVICGDTVETRSVGERVKLLGARGEDLPPLLGVADEVLPGGRELACEHASRAFSVGGSVGLHGGGRKLAWGRNNGGRSNAYREGKLDCDSRVPLPVGPDGRDGAAVITVDKLSMNVVGEKPDGMADTSTFVSLDTSYHSLDQSDDQAVPIEGRVGRVIPDEGECLGIRMTTGDGKLSVAFPEKAGDCAFVIEIMLSVEPAYIEGKAYENFIFAGLPHSKNPVYIDFRIRDTSDWQFTTLPTLDLCRGDGSKFTGTRLRGTLDTFKFNQNTPKNLFIRALRRPTSPEAPNFEMQIETRASFAWRCSDGQIIAEFDIKLEFPGIVPEIGPERNQIHLFITDGPDNRDDLIVESPNGNLVEFSLGEREFVKDDLGRMVKLLQVDRLTDLGNSLRVCFRKEQGMAPQTVGIPTIRARGELKIIGETVSIQTPKLPLLVTCSPDKLFWQEFLTPSIAENNPATRFMRLLPEAGEEVLRVRIDSLAPAHLIADEEFEKKENGYHNFVDQVAYIIEDSVDAGSGFPSVGVSMRFSLGVPLSIGPMDEIIRIHSGGFRLKFVTINHIFVGRGVVFEDGSEVVLLNYDLIEREDDGNSILKREERLMIRVEWSNEANQIIPHQKVQYRLPQMSGKIIGRAVVKCSNREARVIYRAQGPLGALNVSSGFARRRVILAGLCNKSRDLFFEIPYGFKSAREGLRAPQEFEQGRGVSLTPDAPNGGDQTRHNPNAGTGSSDSGYLVSHPGMSITLTDLALQSPMPQGEGRVAFIIGHNHRRWSSKWFFAVFLILILAANFLDQMSRVDGLKGWLRRTETILKEVESSHQRLLWRLASAAQQEPEGAARYMFVIGRLGPSDLLAIVPAPKTESGWKDMLAADINEQGWGETETEGDQEPLQDSYPVKLFYEDTGCSLAHHRGASRVLQEVPLSGIFERAVASTLDYLWGLFLRAYRRHSNNNRVIE